MERRGELRAQLKRWEAAFLQERGRRPGQPRVPPQADVAEAPEETRRLYREYARLKRGREPERAEEAAEEAAEQGSGCWGAHLNRQPRRPALSARERDALQASAQYFGMKLKANLGAAIKERPPGPRRTLMPRPPAVPRLERSLESADKGPSPGPGARAGDAADLPLPPSVSALAPVVLSARAAKPRPRRGDKLQRLQQTVARTLGSLDPGWLRRCQGVPDRGEATAGEASEAPERGAPGPAFPRDRRSPSPEPGGGATAQGLRAESFPDALPDASRRGMRRGTELVDAGAAGDRDGEEAARVLEDQRGSASGSESQRVPQASARDGERDEAGEAPPERDEALAEEGAARSKPARASRKRLRGAGAGGRGALRKRSRRDEEDKGEEAAAEGAPEVSEPAENLLGEVEEEEEGKARCSRRPPAARAAPRREGNFVRLNLKRRSYTRGHVLKGNRLRKQLWKQKWQKKGEQFGGGGGGSLAGSSDVCFRCGTAGHWAAACPGRGCRPPSAGPAAAERLPEEPAHDEEPPLPTLEEVARMTRTAYRPLAPASGGQAGTEEAPFLDVQRPAYEPPAPPAPMEPLYGLGPGGEVQETPLEVFEALSELGFGSFRPGQEVAVMRILSGLSTLVVLPTGMGKSLCYQLPAYLYHKRSKCVTLVISPLVSLMDDQVSGLPPSLRAVCIHSNMSKAQREAAVEKVRAGSVQVLLLSPEALVGGSSASSCLPAAERLPAVAFACIDEAHCVSQWSHNFRPCYLRLCKVLRDRLGVRCFLGLTATATLATARDVAQHLGITTDRGTAVRSAAVPPNLRLSVSMDRDRDEALVSLLQGERFGSLDSVIVYCTRREETARVAALIRTRLHGAALREPAAPGPADAHKATGRKSARSPLRWLADAYHAGLSAAERRRVQSRFMRGQLRVVVATVAFGMGLDKPDVRGVVHYNMPKNFESYVQEIGRAGRDGEPAHCHLFLDPEGGDLHELKRHIYSDAVDYFTIKKLVQRVFSPCKCRELHRRQEEIAAAGEVADAEMAELATAAEQDGTPAEQDGTPAAEQDGTTAERDRTPVEQDEVVAEQNGTAAAEQDGTTAEQNGTAVAEQDGAAAPDNPPASSPLRPRLCYKHERALPVQELVEALDLREEGEGGPEPSSGRWVGAAASPALLPAAIETLLCYLELHPQRWLELLPLTYASCRVLCYGGPRQLRAAARSSPPLAVVLARERLAGRDPGATAEFDVVALSDSMGWEAPLVKRALRQLQWDPRLRAGAGGSGVHVEFGGLSFHLRVYGDLLPHELDAACAFLRGRVAAREQAALAQLRACFRAFRSVAFETCAPQPQPAQDERSARLKALLRDYFERDPDGAALEHEDDAEERAREEAALRAWESQIRSDIRRFLSIRHDEAFTGRAVARVFQGIGDPCFPAQVYGRDRRFWRLHLAVDFHALARLAADEILQSR
ncbi:ATP-dependent DNA helicase Q4 [Eudromia elegans]